MTAYWVSYLGSRPREQEREKKPPLVVWSLRHHFSNVIGVKNQFPIPEF